CYSSGIFTVIAGQTKERFLVHEAVLAQSPVFHAMTTLPVKEKEERTIQLPVDEASHIRCMIAWLYTKNFYTQSECDLRAKFIKSINERQERLSSSSHNPPTVKHGSSLEAGCDTVSPALDIQEHEDNLHSGTDPLTDAERAVAVDLAQIYVLSDKYLLPRFGDCALAKLGNLVYRPKYPVRFLHLVAVLNTYIPESDASFRCFVQESLKSAARCATGDKDKIVSSIIENGFMRGSGVLAEEILSAFAHEDPSFDSF
ncbi:MAG: hypothetical protein Q9191_006379, partial [Dirinaria sp. TL-2023a]